MRNRLLTLILAAALVASACGSNTDAAGVTETTTGVTSSGPTTAAPTAASTSIVATTTPPVTTTPAAEPGTIPADATYEVEISEDVYGSGAVRDGEIDLTVKLFVPIDAPSPRPVYIHLPGGGFQFSDPENAGPAQALAERGFVAASFEYRVQGDDPIPSDRVGGIYDAVGGADGGGLARAIAAAVEDGLLGMAWLLDQADELHLDAERVVVGGGSAGAITANHIAYTADDFAFDRLPVAATVDLWGGFTLAKPADAVSAGEPPVFIVHGTADNVVSYTFTEDLVAAADAVGLPYELYPVEGAGHGVDLTTTTADDGVTLLDHLVQWLQATLYG